MGLVEYRQLCANAVIALDTLNSYAEVQLELADELESNGEDVDELRDNWHNVLTLLNGYPRDYLATDLADSLSPLEA